MPIYKYRCLNCRRQFQKWQAYDDPPEASCPKCGGKARRVIQPHAFFIK